MNAVKIVFPECTNLLCTFHINKNVKAKCKSLIAQKNAWDYVMDCWGSLTDYPSEQQMSTMLLAPTREGYPSVGPEGRLGAAGCDHEAEDLMRGLVS